MYPFHEYTNVCFIPTARSRVFELSQFARKTSHRIPGVLASCQIDGHGLTIHCLRKKLTVVSRSLCDWALHKIKDQIELRRCFRPQQNRQIAFTLLIERIIPTCAMGSLISRRSIFSDTQERPGQCSGKAKGTFRLMGTTSKRPAIVSPSHMRRRITLLTHNLRPCRDSRRHPRRPPETAEDSGPCSDRPTISE